MFERLNTPEEAYNHQLGATLRMERISLGILEKNAEEAQDPQVAQLFRHHHDETESHIRNVEEAFRLMGWQVDDSACPAMQALDKEGKANAKKTDEAIVDSILLQSATEVEHHEIAVYENLIINATAMGRDDVAKVLQRNIDDEQHTLLEVKEMQARVAARTLEQPL